MAADLEREQVELLVRMVEAEQDVPRDQRRWFRVSSLGMGDILQGPTQQFQVVKADLDELEMRGYLRGDYNENYTVTNDGRAFYAAVRQHEGAPAEQADAAIRRYLDGDVFRADYPEAYDRWSRAENDLWAADSEKELTTIGHRLREALQQFATAAVERYQPDDVDPDITKVNRRLGAVIAQKLPDLPESVANLLRSQGDLSEAAVDLVQRQEHGDQKQGAELQWEDARRAVFAVATTMFELARTFERYRRRSGF